MAWFRESFLQLASKKLSRLFSLRFLFFFSFLCWEFLLLPSFVHYTATVVEVGYSKKRKKNLFLQSVWHFFPFFFFERMNDCRYLYIWEKLCRWSWLEIFEELYLDTCIIISQLHSLLYCIYTQWLINYTHQLVG